MNKTPFELMLALLTTEACIICRQPGRRLCEGCFNTHFGAVDSRCYSCNKLTFQNRVCKSCKSSSRLRRVWWLGVLEKELKELILEMKYQRKRETARLFGKYLADTLPYLPPETLVVPIPTVSSRRRVRGYDQALLCAQVFAQKRALACKPLLHRTDQDELIGKNRKQRLNAMEQSLKITPDPALKGSSALLIDDVLTTGASLEAAARLLRQHGATRVDAAVVGRKLLG